jgi:hypothetical protein
MFKWFSIKEFLSTPEEWHALVDGFGLVLCPLFLLVQGIREELLGEIVDELHYFLFGGVLGVWAWIGIVKVLV